MDVATPFRWLAPTALAAMVLGCQGGAKPASQQARPQMPAETAAAPASPPVPLDSPPAVPVDGPPRLVGPPIPGLPLLPESRSESDGLPPPKLIGPPIQGISLAPAPAGLANRAPAVPADLRMPSAPPGAVQTSFSQVGNDRPAARSDLLAGEPRIKIVAIIGKENMVTGEEVWHECKFKRFNEFNHRDERTGRFVEDPVKKQQIYEEELRTIINRELILDDMYERLTKAKKPHVVEEIKQEAVKYADGVVLDLKRRNQTFSDEEFKNMLLSRGLSLPMLRRQAERQHMANLFLISMIREKTAKIELGLADVRDYYDRHPEEFRTTDRVKWQDIFILCSKFVDQSGVVDARARQAAYNHARAIQQAALTGKDFAALSKQYDHGLSGLNGGLGGGSERGKIQPADLEEVVWSLQPGQISNPIETPAGFHIVRIAEREYAAIKPYDEKIQKEARARLMNEMHQIETKRFIDHLWRTSAVKIVQ